MSNVKVQSSNQPFDYPRSKVRGLLRVDTERRFSPRPEGRGLAPSKYQFQITNILEFGICHSFGICLPAGRQGF